MAASQLKIPIILHESNAFPGKAIKMLAGKTDTILVSFKDAIPRIKKGKNVVFTGTPVKIVKKDYTKSQKDKIFSELGLKEEKPIVLVFGGSQGAKRINDTILDMANYCCLWLASRKLNEDKIDI